MIVWCKVFAARGVFLGGPGPAQARGSSSTRCPPGPWFAPQGDGGRRGGQAALLTPSGSTKDEASHRDSRNSTVRVTKGRVKSPRPLRGGERRAALLKPQRYLGLDPASCCTRG